MHALLPPWCIHAIQLGSELLFVEGLPMAGPRIVRLSVRATAAMSAIRPAATG